MTTFDNSSENDTRAAHTPAGDEYTLSAIMRRVAAAKNAEQANALTE